LTQEDPIRIHKKSDFAGSFLVIGWRGDLGNLGLAVTDYLNQKLQAEEFAEIDPEGFFSLGGVAVQADVARFPESKFYFAQEHQLTIFQSHPPEAEPYKFLNSVLDVAVHHCQVREIYVVGAMVSFSAHTAPRQLISVVNFAQMKEVLNQYDLIRDMDYQTSPGERPTLNSFLLWLAKRRNIPAISLWAPIPFYLVATGDCQAEKRVLAFLNERLSLRIELSDLDQKIREQNETLAQARSHSPQIDDYISRLESNLMLSEEENADLIKKVAEFLHKGD